MIQKEFAERLKELPKHIPVVRVADGEYCVVTSIADRAYLKSLDKQWKWHANNMTSLTCSML